MSQYGTDSSYNCANVADPNYPSGGYGGRGVTLWGPVSAYLAPGGGTTTWSFTGTKPKCYQDRDNCNVMYTLHTAATKTTGTEVGAITVELNKYTNPPRLRSLGNHYHSKIANHDLTETIDIGSQAVPEYHDTELNTITFTNNDLQIGVHINDFQIVRVYGMCGMDKEGNGCCTSPNPDPCNPPGVLPCSAQVITSANGNLDYTRQDYPCNKVSCGNRLSYSIHAKDRHHKSVDPNNGTADWTWTNPVLPPTVSNYVGKKKCFFNLNNIQLRTEPASEDVHFTLSVNNSPTEPEASYPKAHYYMSKIKAHHNAAASVDLANTYPFSSYYNDNPGAQNTVVLTNKSSVLLLLCDGSDTGPTCDDCFNGCPNSSCCGSMGCIDVYRVYETTTNCKTITAYANPMYGSINPFGSVQVPQNADQSFQINANISQGYFIDQILVDGSPLPNVHGLASYNHPFYNVTANHTITVSFYYDCGTCQITCQETCQATCQTTCEVQCQTCYTSCQPCQTCIACYTCYISCQDACQLACQNCQTPCDVSCQSTCEVSCQGCQTACDTACQTGCQVSCQDTCQLACQTSCQVSCQTGCEVSCQDMCVFGCQACESSCDVTCQNCQTSCQVSCQTTCDTACQTACEVSCQASCYLCYYCYGCLYCEDVGYW